jgi:hypothetical protein
VRIRSIKPEFWRSDDVSALDPVDRLLFIGLWSYVDDNGVGIDKLAAITADLFAGDLERDASETFARVSRGLANLADAALIVRYAVDGKPYLAVTGWGRHQRIDKAGKPRYPGPDQGIQETLATPSRESRESPAPGTGEQGNRGTEEQGGGARDEISASPVDNSGDGAEPPIRCPRHLDVAIPPACGSCKDARLAHDAWALLHRGADRALASALGSGRKPAWDPATHCEHGQILGRCEICQYEASRAGVLTVGPWGGTRCDVDAARSPATS